MRSPPQAGQGTADPAALATDPFSEEFLSDPYAYHADLRDAGAVLWLEKYGVYAMARHSEVIAALKDWETYASSRGVGLADFSREPPWRPPSLLLEADPPLHDRTRGLMNRVASLSAIKSHREEWKRKAEVLVDELVERRRFDAVRDLAEVYPLQVFPDLIGLPEHGREHLLIYAAATFNAFGPRNAIFEAGNRAAESSIEWIAEVCRRENLAAGGWGQDVYAAADAGVCSEAEAERLVRSFLSAGVDTTVNGLANLLYAFVKHPGQWVRLVDDPTLARRAFEESLRWRSTVQTFFRTTTRAVDVAGVTIPEEAKVLLFLAAANRDPRRWGDDAERFDIARVTSGHVAFGFGIHQCLGQMVARQESELILEALAARIKSIRPLGPPLKKLNNTLIALSSLPVEVEPR